MPFITSCFHYITQLLNGQGVINPVCGFLITVCYCLRAMPFYLAHKGYMIRKKAPLSMQLAKGPFLHREKRSHVILLSLLSYLLFAKLLKFIRHKLYLRTNHHLHAGLSGTDHTGYPR